jgi:hypothetical protein
MFRDLIEPIVKLTNRLGNILLFLILKNIN